VLTGDERQWQGGEQEVKGALYIGAHTGGKRDGGGVRMVAVDIMRSSEVAWVGTTNEAQRLARAGRVCLKTVRLTWLVWA
jgi:hypothetical protein